MVAIITGNGLGLERSSAWLLGSRGQVGSAALGRDEEDVYVNAATGNLVIHGNDEVLLGRFVGADVGHSYNSLSAGGYDNGDNWMADVSRKVTGLSGTLNSSGSTITRTDWDGSEEVFTWDSTASCYVFKDGKGADDTLSFASNVWTWTDGDTQNKELYDSLNGGRLTNFNSPIGFGLTYSYTSGGKLDKITTIDNEYIAFAWDTNNNLTSLVTHTGSSGSVSTTRVRYGYDSYNRLTSVTTDLSPDDNSVTDGNVYTISYTYDDSGGAGTGKRIASIAQQDGSLVQFTYTLVGSDYRVASYTQTVSAGVTRTTTFDYSMSGRTTVTDPAGQKTILFYDSAKRLTQISYPLEDGNTTPRVAQFTWDGDGNLLTADLGPGNVVSYDYDHDRLVMQRDSAGNTVTYGYGTQNQLLTETHYLTPDPDGAGANPPTDPTTTHYAYDALLRMTFAVSPAGHVTEYRYNDAGLRSIQIDYTADTYSGSDFSDSALASWAGGASKVTTQRSDTNYDPRGNVSTVTSYSVIDGTSGAGVTTADYTTTTYVYDYGGRLLSRHTNADSTSEVFVYDGLGRLTQSTDFAGNVTKSYFLDALGQTVLTHANGLSEISTYNRAGELIAHSESTAGGNLVDLSGWPGNPGSVPSGQATVTNWQNPSVFTDETHWVTTTGPDGLQVVAMRSGQSDSSAEGGGNVTNNVAIDPTKAYEFTYYFKFSDLDKHYAFFGTSSTSPSTVVNLATGVDDSNGYFFYAYPDGGMESANFTADKWYKVVGYVLPYDTATSSAKLGGVYDVETGQKVLSDYVTYRWSNISQTQAYARFLNYYGQTNQLDSTYFYQPEIRQVSIPTALGPDSATSLYRYDSLGRLRMTVDPTGRRQYMMYDSLDRKVADIDADGAVTEYRYDGNDNLTSTTHYANKLTSTQLASLIDSNGNPTSSSFASLRPTADSANDRWTFQVYDAAQRVIQTIDGTGATSVYAYDGASRVTSTKTYANRLSSTVLANLKAEASNPNLWANPGNATLWSTSNLTVSAVSGTGATIEGVQAYQFTVTNADQYEAFATSAFSGNVGDALAYTISIKGVGSLTVDVTGIFDSSSSWGSSSDSAATVVSGPGAISQWTGGLFTVSGLSTTDATRITVSRKLLQDESATVLFYVRSLDYSLTGSGDAVIVGAPVFSKTHTTALNLPTADTANDRVSRSFYDADGRVIATLDAAGGLSETVYDGAGRKIREIGYANKVTSSTRNTDDLSALRTSAGTSAADRRTDYVYDPRGFLRYTVDAGARPTEYVYDLAGRVISTIDYATPITAASSYSLSYVQAHLSTSASDRITRTVYDADGRAAFSIDAEGGVVALTYDSVGNVIKQVGYATIYTTGGEPSLSTMQSWATTHASDTGNRLSRIVYDVHGRVAYTVDAENHVVEHRYDAAGRAAKDIVYAGTYSVSDTDTKETLANLIGSLPSTAIVTSYAYDADGRLSDATQDVDSGVTATTHYAYDALGELTDKTAAYGTSDASTVHYTYDAAGRVSVEVRGYGTTDAIALTYDYDAVGNLLVMTDAESHIWVRTYDAVGRVLTETAPVDAVSADDLVTTNEYDAFGDLVKVTDPRLNSSYNYYDSLGRVTLQSDAEGYITQTSYTAFSQVYQVTRRAVRGTGTPTVTAAPTIVTDAKDATTSFAYDRNGRVTSVTDAEGKDEASTYDAFGDRTKVRNKLGSGLVPTDSTYDSYATTYTFDRLGRELTETLPVSAQLADGTNQATSITTQYEYDARGNRTKMTEAYGLAEQRITNYVYDKGGRLTTVTHDAVTATATDLVTTSTVTPTESYSYDLRGDLIQSVDAGGGKTLSYYDVLGRKTDEVSAVGTLSHWTYDRDGNMLTARVYGDAVTVPSSPGGSPPSPVSSTNYRETGYSYDRSNRLIGTTVASLQFGAYNGTAYVVTSSAGLDTGTAYDKNGNVVRETDGLGNYTLTWYDKLDRKVAQVDREGYLTTWTLDANGNATSETRYATKITSSYSEATAYTSLAGLAGTNAADRTTTFGYDRNGRRLTETRASVAASTVSGTGALTAATADATITYTYNALGQVLSKTEANGDVTDYSYDKGGRLTTVKTAAISDYAGTTVRPETDYYYDGLGDVVRTKVHGDVYASTTDRVTTSAYGAGGRLASTTDATSFTVNYAYDAAGRVVKQSWTRLKSDGSTSVTEATASRYDLAGRLVTQANATLSGSSYVFGAATRIRYDSYGEVTGRGLTAGPSDTAVYQEAMDYDAGGRMWRTTAGDGTIKIMLYDKAGNATLTLSSVGADLSSYTEATAAATLSSAGATSISNAVTTIGVFDKRGQQTQSREPGRQLTSSTTTTLVTGRAYNAFGEVASDTDARSNATSYSYNVLGKLTQKVSPIVNWTGEDGTVHTTDHPTESYYYDISGRLVGVRDANDYGAGGTAHYTTRALLAGTGHDGSDGLVTAEFHLDGGVARTFYDAFGDARVLRNELSTTSATTYNSATDETRAYDKLGRLVTDLHLGGLLTDSYVYDGLGRRTRHTNDLLGSSAVERTDYDLQGRVTLQTNMAGDATTTSYAWSGTLATTGLGTFGGWTKTTTDPSSNSATENDDYFGRTIGKTDFGSHSSSYTFDLGGRLTQESGSGGQVMNYSWFNTGNLYQVADTAGTGMNAITSTYGYDEAGNRTYEGYAGTVYSTYYGGTSTSSTLTLQNATIAYDALNRITSFTDKDASNVTRITVANEYDLNGNVRRTTSTYPDLANPSSSALGTDKYYRYDAMNRMVVADGALVSGAIVRGYGYDITYDAAGRRATQTRDVDLIGRATNDAGDGGGHFDVSYSGERREEYTYRADGELYTVKFAETGYTNNHDGTVSPTTLPSSGTLRAEYDRDAMGRITEYREFGTNGTTVTRDRYGITYDNRSNVGEEYLSQVKVESGISSDYLTHTTNSYTTDGRLSSVTSDEYKGGWDSTSDAAVPDTLMSYSYAWYDGARVSSTSYDSDTGSTSNTLFTSTYYYDALGRVGSVDIADGRRRTVSFAYAPEGQVLNRKERSAASANPEDQYYFVNGAQYGELTSNGHNDPTRVDYATNLNILRNLTPDPASAPFRWNTTAGDTQANFGPVGYQPLNPYGDGTASSDSTYTVHAGETLQSIAASTWGDASLWYLIADANGMSGGENLIAGTSLILPDRVSDVHNSASTFKVYDPNQALGDLNPTAAKPPKKAGGCGVMGQILMVAIAVAVTAVTAGAAIAALTPGMSILAGIGTFAAGTAGAGTMVAAGAVGGAMGSIASQGFGIAIGQQNQFDWKGVAMGAISGAIGGGLGKVLGQAGIAGNKILTGAVRGLAGSALGQGIGVATGLQGKFDWAGIAGAAVGGGLSGALGGQIGHLGAFGGSLAGSAVGGLANAGARSLIDGTDFGDNLVAALPDIIGQTIGNMIGDGISGGVQGSSSTGDAPISLLDSSKVASYSSSIKDVIQPLPDFGGVAPNENVSTYLDDASTPQQVLQARFGSSVNIENAGVMTVHLRGTDIPLTINDGGNFFAICRSDAHPQFVLVHNDREAWNLACPATSSPAVVDASNVPALNESGQADPSIAQALYDRQHPVEAAGAGTVNLATGLYHAGRDSLWLNPITGPYVLARGLYNGWNAWETYRLRVALGQANPLADGWHSLQSGWDALTRMGNVYAIGGLPGFLRQYGEPTGHYVIPALATGVAGRLASIGELGAAESEFTVAGRVGELRDAIPADSRGRITMAVGVAEDTNGTQRILIGTSEPNGYLRRGVALNPGETLAPGLGHAEVDIVTYAEQNNLRLLEVGATRPVCPLCVPVLERAGVRIVTPVRGR